MFSRILSAITGTKAVAVRNRGRKDFYGKDYPQLPERRTNPIPFPNFPGHTKTSFTYLLNWILTTITGKSLRTRIWKNSGHAKTSFTYFKHRPSTAITGTEPRNRVPRFPGRIFTTSFPGLANLNCRSENEPAFKIRMTIQKVNPHSFSRMTIQKMNCGFKK